MLTAMWSLLGFLQRGGFMFSLSCLATLALSSEASGWDHSESAPVDFLFEAPLVEPLHHPHHPHHPPPPPPALQDSTFSPNGRYTASIDAHGLIRVRDLQQGHEIYQFHAGQVKDGFVSFSLDGRYLAAPGTDNRVLVIDLVAGKPLRQLQGSKRPPTDVKFLDGRTAVARFGDRALKTFDIQTGEELHSLTEPPGAGKKLAVVPGTDLLFTPVGNNLQATRLDGVVVREFAGHQDRISGFALFKDRKKLVTVSEDQTTRIWNADNGKELQKFTDYGPEEDPLRSVDVSPDGEFLAEAHGEVIRLRRINKQSLAQEGKRDLRHGGLVTKVEFRPDGQVVMSSGEDGQLRLWNVSTGLPVGAPVASTAEPSGTETAPADLGRTARVLVELPDGARLFVDGKAVPDATRQTSILTPPLEPGREYFYTLRAEITRDGQNYELSRRVVVTAGQSRTVVFPQPGTTSPAELRADAAD
jgi:uncharacterized protein (TIGR03000 family)